MSEKPILPTGLDALLGGVEKTSKSTVRDIELSLIVPNRFQPREHFDETKLKELAESINKHGVLSPIIVRESSADRFEIIAGERRFRAASQNGLKTIPCLIDNAENQTSLEIALIENLQRENLNPIEEAKGFDRLKREFGLTQEEISGVTGKARSTIANSIRILSLPEEVKQMIAEGLIEKGHAKILASLESDEAIKKAKEIVQKSLSVKDLSSFGAPGATKKTKKTKHQDIKNLEQDMSESFGHQIEISETSKSKGTIIIHYRSADERETIIGKIKHD
ncbi:MAG: ParB/RepB/Spo0J family partition protein [Gammaproteobacteria bacterium]